MSLPFTKETLGDASKKDLVVFLQANATDEFLSKHKLKGQEKAIMKKAKLPALHAAYNEAIVEMHSVMPALAAAMRPMTPALAGPKIGAASHILIRHADTAEVADLGDSVEAACAALKKQLDDGADFAALAKLHSTCPSAKSGGDLGNFPQGQMVKEFDSVVFDPHNMKDVVYGPIKTKFGFHLIKITDPKSAEEGIRMIKHGDYLNDPGAMRIAKLQAESAANAAEAVAAAARRMAKLTISMPSEPRPEGVPGLEDMPNEVIARILRLAEPAPLVRLHMVATCAKLRKAVKATAPTSLFTIDFTTTDRNQHLSNRGLRNVAAISGGNLTKIDVSGCMSLSRAVLVVLAKSNPKLEEISVRFETSWSVEAVTETCETLNKHCPNFKKLNINLRNDKPTGEVLTLLNKATRGFVNIRKLELVPLNRSEQEGHARMANETPPLLTTQEIRELIGALNDGAELEELDLSFNRLGLDHITIAMEGLGGVASLGKLNLRFNGFADAGTHVIAAGLHGESATQLTFLDLSFNGVGIDGATSLAEALSSDSCVIESLDLKCNNVAEDGAEALAEALRVNKSLKWLELGVNAIENGGTWELADCLEDNHTLAYLGLSGNGITAEGIEFFPAAMRKNTGLRTLDLSMNKLSDDGAKAVATMLTSSQEDGHDCMLASVDIDQNGISDVGADALATALGGNARLLNLRMRTNFVSETQVKWLQTVGDRMLPGIDRVDAILQKSRPDAKGAPKKLTKQQEAKKAEERRAAERREHQNR